MNQRLSPYDAAVACADAAHAMQSAARDINRRDADGVAGQVGAAVKYIARTVDSLAGVADTHETAGLRLRAQHLAATLASLEPRLRLLSDEIRHLPG